MPIIAPLAEFDEDKPDDLPVRQLSAAEAQALRDLHPMVSPWRVVAWQGLIGSLTALVVWGLTQKPSAAWSAAYGAVAVLIPAALFARGLLRQRQAPSAGSALAGFAIWELVKITLTMAMLFAAPSLILNLNWLALLAGFVVTMKVQWVAIWLRPKRRKSVGMN